MIKHINLQTTFKRPQKECGLEIPKKWLGAEKGGCIKEKKGRNKFKGVGNPCYLFFNKDNNISGEKKHN